MKIVINKCFGGFGLSRAAIKAYLKRKGKRAFLYEIETVNGHIVGLNNYVRAKKDSDSLFAMISTRDLGPKVTSAKLCDAKNYFSARDIERTDPDLIAVVEEMGDKASGQCASLGIIEIPDGTDWEIDEYDGNETVHEKHRSWS